MCGGSRGENATQSQLMMLLCTRSDAHDADAQPSVQAVRIYLCTSLQLQNYSCMYWQVLTQVPTENVYQPWGQNLEQIMPWKR